MFNNKNLTLLMMLTSLAGRVVMSMFPFLGLSSLSTLFAVLTLFTMCYCLYDAYRKNSLITDKRLLSLFIVYTLFVAYQLFFSGILPLEICSTVPDGFLLSLITFEILIISQLSQFISKNLNFERFAKMYVIIVICFIYIYNSNVSFAVHQILRQTDFLERDTPDGYMSGLTIGGYISVMQCCCIYLYDKWTKKLFVSRFISIALILLGLLIMALIFERGPLLFFFITLLVVIVARGHFSPKYGFAFIMTVSVISVVSDELVVFFESYFPVLAEKLTDTTGTGRYGGEDSLSSLALSQIFQHPFLGYHCRLLNISVQGMYSHNLILEFLMTVGVVFTFPLLVLLYKAAIQSYKLIKYNRPESLFAMIFINRSLCLLTSGTPINNLPFWFSFFFILATIKYIDFNEPCID